MILFPTPNRVWNAEVLYNGRSYRQIKNGEERVCHGLVYDEPFRICETVCGDNSALLELVLNIDENTDFFASFPFKSRLHIIYVIDACGLTVKYKLYNLSDRSFQFGFGIHPYFNFKANDRLIISSSELLELENNFPTG